MEGFPSRAKRLLAGGAKAPSDGHAAAMRQAWELLRPPENRSPVMLGPRGSGKTVAATVLAHAWTTEALEAWLGLPTDVRAPRALYACLSELLRREQDSFGEPSNSVTPFDRAVEAPLLVLDEIHEARVTAGEWATERFVSLFDQRYRSERPTILIANMQPAAFRQISESVWDRLREYGGVVVFGGGSLRGNPIRPLP